MEITTLCAVVATLRVLPSRSQFFQYESVSLSCEQQGNSSEWGVRRNASTRSQDSLTWDRMNESSRFIDKLYPLDSGEYWCESAAGECSNTVSIIVTGGSVILESPVLPVMEGDHVTLSCRSASSSSPPADFYKDGVLIRSSSTANMTIHSVSRSDEGLYKCNISGAGGSPESRLTVRGHLKLLTANSLSSYSSSVSSSFEHLHHLIFTMKTLTVSALLCAMMTLNRAVVPPQGRAGDGSTEKSHLVKRSTSCGTWSEINGRCFHYVQRPMTWAKAEKNCQSMGGHLASIHNDLEHREIQKLTTCYGQKETWVGGADAEEENQWFWSDGSRFRYTNWCSGEPNNHSGRQSCLHVNHGAKKCWDDYQCHHKSPSVCVKKM